MASVPWALLRLSGASEPLVSSTAISFVALSRAARSTKDLKVADVSVLVSSPSSAAQGALRSASEEPAVITASLPRDRANVRVSRNATRQDVARALADSEGWVHVAAHGVARPDRIGYAGIWVSPSRPADAPDFLSWIDVLTSGSQAGLVVLDTCELGASADTATASLGFSSALSRAGAANVVSALWQVSDAASATWVSAFYSALSEGNPDAAQALRAAQNRLRESRAFRHPYYWASLVHFARIPVGRPRSH